MIRHFITFSLGLLIGAGAVAFLGGHVAHTPYAGQQDRQISSLSAADIEALEAGAGWGLAKPAELNGFPGPAHVLELAKELELTPDQQAAVQARFDAMNAEARVLGAEFVEAEAALDAAFNQSDVTASAISARLSEAEKLRASLRETHLVAHLDVTPLLTDAQIETYVELRGYGAHGSHDHAGH